MDHEAGQCVPVGLRQLTDSMIQQGQAVAIILDFYKKKTFILVKFIHVCSSWSSPFPQSWLANKLQIKHLESHQPPP